jgi:hypothetical protein
MEMTFPHHALRQDSVTSRIDHKAMFAVIAARQANSRTVRALRRAAHDTVANGDLVGQRIHYFACGGGGNSAVRGAFWRDMRPEPTCEHTVYQADLANIKDDTLDPEPTGEQLNHAGHGASRKL